MLPFNGLDYAILGVVLFSVVISIFRGFIREVCSLTVWIVSFFLSFYFYKNLSKILESVIHSNSARSILSFLIIFISVFVLGTFINYLLCRLLDKAGLRGLDRVLGIVFGAARGVLVIAVLLMLARFTPIVQQPYWRHSFLIAHFKPLENYIHDSLPRTVTERVELKSQ